MSHTPTLERVHPAGMGGVQKLYDFPNGYGASVVQFPGSYGYDAGLWEVAVMHNDHLVYDTPVTDDVLGRLTWTEVEDTLSAIAELPVRP